MHYEMQNSLKFIVIFTKSPAKLRENFHTKVQGFFDP